MSDGEFERYWKAIEKNERWETGEQDFIEKGFISGVHKKKGVIIEYLVHTKMKACWVSKQEALRLAMEGRLRAILVRMKNGNHYLRPEYGQQSFVTIT